MQVAFLVLVAVLARLGWVLGVPNEPVSDFAAYHRAAAAISSGQMYWAAENIWPVGYPAVLGLVYATVGTSVVAAKLLNVILAASSVFLLYEVALKVFADRVVAFAGSLAFAVYPEHVMLSGLVAAENLNIPLLLVAALAFHSLAHAGSMRSRTVWSLIAGGAIAIATLVRPLSVIFLGAAFVWCFLRGSDRKECVAFWALALVTVLLLVGCWVAVNYVHSRKLVLVSSNGGVNLLIGNHPQATGTYRWPVEGFDARGLDLADRDRKAARLAIRYILRDPAAFLRRVPPKLDYLFSRRSDPLWWTLAGLEHGRKLPARVEAYVDLALTLSLLLLKWGALAGALASLKDRELLLEQLFTLSYLAGIAVFFGTARFRLPLLPFLILLCFAGVARLKSMLAPPERASAGNGSPGPAA